jgi:hypothetical protein
MAAKDFSLDGADRPEWNRAWAAMSHRSLAPIPPLDSAAFFGFGCGDLVSLTLSANPPEFREMVYRPCETCPVCGLLARSPDRIAASLHATWKTGLSLSVWVHRVCFEGCSEAAESAPVPW